MLEMTLRKRIVNPVIKTLFHILFKIDDPHMKNISYDGPLLIVSNHVNFFEGPYIATSLYPRKFSALAKRESWNNPFFKFLFNTWELIPLNRDDSDIVAMKKGIRVLANNHLLGIFPEGTRSKDGRLIQGKPGTTVLSTQTNATVLPVACWGHENYKQDFKNLRRPPFNVKVGNPFKVIPLDRKEKKQNRQEVTDQIMFQLAGTLPEYYRGYYADQASASESLLQFPPDSSSNLAR